MWGDDYFGSDHVVDVHIANLRKKVEQDPSDPRYVQTVRVGRVQVPPAMKRLRGLPRGLGAKLFISHFLVALGGSTLLTAILVIVPVVFGNLAGGTGEVVGSVAQVFGRTLLYSLFSQAWRPRWQLP